MRTLGRDAPTPLVCTCEAPDPELVVLLGFAPVEGAYECRRCRRKVT